MTKISIIIPLFNGALLITRSLDSVFAQHGNFELEVIVIDDGSTDNSVELLKQYPKPIVLMQQVNQGPAAARNKGIETATGKFLAFLDADDYWGNTFLHETVAFLESHPEAIAVSVGQIHKIPGKPDVIAPKILQTEPTKYNAPILVNDFYAFWAEHNHVCTGSVLMKTETVKKTGGQRTELRITEDLEFWAYLATFGSWGFIPEVLFVSDGAKVTQSQGWWKKNYKRWVSAPSIEDWEKRVLDKKPNLKLDRGYKRATGRIAKNLSYAALLTYRFDLSITTIQNRKFDFPNDQLSKLLILGSNSFVFFFIISFVLIIRERLK